MTAYGQNSLHINTHTLFFHLIKCHRRYATYIFATVFSTCGKMIRQLAIICGCLAAGEFIIWLTGIPLPSSIVGMIILTLSLKLGIVKLEWVQNVSEALVSNIGFFFVPPGVAVMLYFDVIKAEFWPIVTATVVSTILVLAVTGWVHQLFGKKDFENKPENKA